MGVDSRRATEEVPDDTIVRPACESRTERSSMLALLMLTGALHAAAFACIFVCYDDGSVHVCRRSMIFAACFPLDTGSFAGMQSSPQA